MCAAIYLAYEIYIVYSGKEKIKKEIHDYYYTNYNQLGINYLRKSLLDYNTDKMNDSLSLSDNIELFENIYIQKLNRQENNYDEMDTLLSDVFSKFNKQGEKSKLTKLNNTVVSIYVKANSFDTPFALKLWDEISYPVYESWRIVDLSQWDMRQAITSLNKELYINQIITKEIVNNYKDNPIEEFVAYNCNNLPYFAVELYQAMKKSNGKEYGASTKNRLLGDSILLLSRLLSSNTNKKTNETFVYKNRQILLELLNLYRLLAYFKENEIIKEYIFERNFYRSDNIIISRFILLIYLYYLSKEPLISDDLKDGVKKIIYENKSAVYRCISQLNSAIIKEFYPFLLDLMSTWEEMPRKGGKTIIIDKIITDAVVFSFAVINRYEKEAELSSVIKSIFNKRIDNAYSLYCRDDDSITEEWIKQFTEFFCLPINYYSESVNFLRKVISNLRLKQEIETLNQSLWDSRKKYQELVSNLINNFMEDNKFLFSNENEEYIYQKSTACLLLQKRINASSLNAEDRIELLEPLIKDNIIQNLVEKCISNKLIKVEKISRNDKYKQKRLIELANKQGLSVDTFIGREYIPHESNPSLIKKQYNNIHSFEPNYRDNRLFLINSKKLTATISDIQFSMYPCNAKNLEYEKKEITDGTILYQTIDGEYLPFSKTQYRRYLKHNIKIIYVTAIIRIKASSGICGVGIEIEK